MVGAEEEEVGDDGGVILGLGSQLLLPVAASVRVGIARTRASIRSHIRILSERVLVYMRCWGKEWLNGYRLMKAAKGLPLQQHKTTRGEQTHLLLSFPLLLDPCPRAPAPR